MRSKSCRVNAYFLLLAIHFWQQVFHWTNYTDTRAQPQPFSPTNWDTHGHSHEPLHMLHQSKVALDSTTLAMSKACKKCYNSWNTYILVPALEPSTASHWTCTNLWQASQLQSYKTPNQYHGQALWVDTARQFLHANKGQILLQKPWIPVTWHHNDCYIMEDILGLNLPKQQTSQLYSVQLYLHVTTLSKITNHTRWKLLHTKLQCPNSCNT